MGRKGEGLTARRREEDGRMGDEEEGWARWVVRGVVGLEYVFMFESGLRKWSMVGWRQYA